MHIRYLMANVGMAMTLSFACLQAGHAAVLFNVSLDTTPLIGHPAAPFFLEFQLNDGLGIGDANNTALLSNFDFGSGMPVGTATLIGGASGDLSSHIVLADNSFFNEFIQEFMPGNTLSFDVELSTSIDPGPQPDQFSFAILDCRRVEIPTRGPADALVLVNIDSSSPAIRAFAGDPSRPTACADEPVFLGAPMISGVPEPGTGGMVILGLAILLILQRSVRSIRPW